MNRRPISNSMLYAQDHLHANSNAHNGYFSYFSVRTRDEYSKFTIVLNFSNALIGGIIIFWINDEENTFSVWRLRAFSSNWKLQYLQFRKNFRLFFFFVYFILNVDYNDSLFFHCYCLLFRCCCCCCLSSNFNTWKILAPIHVHDSNEIFANSSTYNMSHLYLSVAPHIWEKILSWKTYEYDLKTSKS